jgi:hypothetical protein
MIVLPALIRHVTPPDSPLFRVGVFPLFSLWPMPAPDWGPE